MFKHPIVYLILFLIALFCFIGCLKLYYNHKVVSFSVNVEQYFKTNNEQFLEPYFINKSITPFKGKHLNDYYLTNPTFSILLFDYRSFSLNNHTCFFLLNKNNIDKGEICILLSGKKTSIVHFSFN